MSDEQKAAASERLAKAREKRLKENPPKYNNIHPSVLAKPDDSMLSFKKVRQWIKEESKKPRKPPKMRNQGFGVLKPNDS